MESKTSKKLDLLDQPIRTDNQKEYLEEILKTLILYLEEKGLININDLAEKLGIITPVRLIPIYFKHRLNYKKIAQDLLEGFDVLLPISKKNAYYLRKRLKQMLKREIYSTIVYVSGKKYYLFSLEKLEEKLPTHYEFIKKS
jgi:hypothetical protein